MPDDRPLSTPPPSPWGVPPPRPLPIPLGRRPGTAIALYRGDTRWPREPFVRPQLIPARATKNQRRGDIM